MVNEARVGRTGGATLFNPNYSIDMWNGGDTGVADTKGYQLNLNGTMSLANAASSTTPSSREASTFVIEDSLSWIKGAHNLNFGASYTRADVWLKNQTLVPTVNFGLATATSARCCRANFRARRAQFCNAQNTRPCGRVTGQPRRARREEFEPVHWAPRAAGWMRSGLRSDSWRIRRNLPDAGGATDQAFLRTQLLQQHDRGPVGHHRRGAGLRAGVDRHELRVPVPARRPERLAALLS
jgi:hypothetical protein